MNYWKRAKRIGIALLGVATLAIALLISQPQPGITQSVPALDLLQPTEPTIPEPTIPEPTIPEPTTTFIQSVPWNFRADRFRGQWGDDVTLYCPANGAPQQIWGSDVYSDNSSICTAAVHAGLITVEEGGAIAIRILPGQSTYAGSSQNDITSSSIDQWTGSFTFTTLRDFVAGVTVTGREILPLNVATWSTTAKALASPVVQSSPFQVSEQSIALYCPSGGEPASVWGSDIYEDTSSVCSAAVHAGRINRESGGAIAIKLASRQPFYIGSTRNGITTRHGLIGDRSFIFID
ncbi:MAG: LCCL domain-containing protein [Elainellaceae cyanobacterium]